MTNNVAASFESRMNGFIPDKWSARHADRFDSIVGFYKIAAISFSLFGRKRRRNLIFFAGSRFRSTCKPIEKNRVNSKSSLGKNRN